MYEEERGAPSTELKRTGFGFTAQVSGQEMGELLGPVGVDEEHETRAGSIDCGRRKLTRGVGHCTHGSRESAGADAEPTGITLAVRMALPSEECNACDCSCSAC